MKNNFKYMVCINCHTYNQSNYIVDALNGFTMQKTNFPFIIMLVDDASTDGEQKVIAEYIQNHFEIDTHTTRETDYALIQLGQHTTNKNCFIVIHYLKYNHHQIRKAKDPYLSEWRINSKYEALCEGDDFWIDSLKLQKQVDFLRSHPEYSMCFTNARVIHEDGAKKQSNLYKHLENKDYTGIEILDKWTIPTASVIYINNNKYPPRDSRFIYGDIILFLHLEKQGKIYCINEEMVVYRRNQGGITSKKINYKKSVKHYEAILEHFGNKYATTINKLIAKTYIHSFLASRLKKDSWEILIEANKKYNISKFFWLLLPSIIYKIIKNKLYL